MPRAQILLIIALMFIVVKVAVCNVDESTSFEKGTDRVVTADSRKNVRNVHFGQNKPSKSMATVATEAMEMMKYRTTKKKSDPI